MPAADVVAPVGQERPSTSNKDSSGTPQPQPTPTPSLGPSTQSTSPTPSQTTIYRKAHPPLTTLWTRPTDCILKQLMKTSEVQVEASIGPDEAKSIKKLITSSCYPPGFEQGATFSPGLCPVGFTIAEVNVQFATTTAVCHTLSVPHRNFMTYPLHLSNI